MRKTKFIIIVLLGCIVAPQTADAQILGTILGVTKGLLESSKNSKKAKKNEATQNLNAESAPSTQNSNTKSAPSNPNDEVTLVVSSDGKTKDEAVKTALRSAIEQAYGTFVSANTTILNDELVKDEIVTISNGNIRNYEEIACNISQDGKTYVTLKATVSISKLVSYAQSKGATTEFAGSTFGMNMRMKDLNKKNEEIALRNLAEQVIALYPSAFSYKLSVAEPQKIAKDQSGYYYFSRFFKYWTPSFEDIADFGLTGSDEDYYISGFEVSIEPNEQMDAIVNLIFNTVNSLALSRNELKEYKTHNIPYFSSKIFAGEYGDAFIREKCSSKYKELRNKYKYVIPRDRLFHILEPVLNKSDVEIAYSPDEYNKYKELFEELETFKIGGGVFKFRSDYRIPFVDMNVAIAKILHSFEIIDNMGNSSRISEWENKYGKTFFPASGTNLLSPWVNYSFKKSITSIEEQTEYEIGTGIELFYTGKDLGLYIREEEALTLFRACFFIPKNEIQKYSSFTIRAVPVNNTVFKYSEDCINELYKSEY